MARVSKWGAELQAGTGLKKKIPPELGLCQQDAS